jgi:protein TonB
VLRSPSRTVLIGAGRLIPALLIPALPLLLAFAQTGAAEPVRYGMPLPPGYVEEPAVPPPVQEPAVPATPDPALPALPVSVFWVPPHPMAMPVARARAKAR